jgi:hypothetical protein
VQHRAALLVALAQAPFQVGDPFEEARVLRRG